MIQSFVHRGLRDLYMNGRSRGVRPDLQQRCVRRLDALDRAKTVSDLDLPGFGLHRLRGKPVRYSLRVNGPWRITFEWRDEPVRVDLEQYH